MLKTECTAVLKAECRYVQPALYSVRVSEDDAFIYEQLLEARSAAEAVYVVLGNVYGAGYWPKVDGWKRA